MKDIGLFILDDYETGYSSGLSVSDAAMSSVLGETQYVATGHPNGNSAVGKHPAIPGSSNYYCAGCNGSFLLDFTSTSIGDIFGVYGVGIDIRENRLSFPYVAFVRFGDDSTTEFLLSSVEFEVVPSSHEFWGIISDVKIKSIHFGLENGGVTTAGSFAIDNLVIGLRPVSIPTPSTLYSLSIGLVGLAGLRRLL